MDYRNLPFKFGYGGLDVLSAPENVKPGFWTRFMNVRYRRDGTLEARHGSEEFKGFYTQPSIPVQGYIYPDRWNIGPMSNTKYIGKILNNGAEIDGWISVHVAETNGATYGNTYDFVTFINGVPLNYNGCPVFTSPTTPVSPQGYSIIRTVAKTGIPITLIDGRYFVINKECDIASPTLFTTTGGCPYQYGDETATIPFFRAYKMGITAPASAPTVAAKAGTALTVGDYYYAYSYYSTTTGFESELSPSSTKYSASGGNLAATITSVVQSTDPQVTSVRLWRKGGTLTSSWRLVTTVGLEGCADDPLPFSYDDTTSDQTLAVEEKFDTDTVAPFSTVNANGSSITAQQFYYNWGPFLGKYHFWVGDPVKKGYLYWNKAGDISRYHPLTGVLAVADPGEDLQNGFIFSSTPFVFSKLNLYALDYGGADALPEFSARQIPIGMGLAGRWAFAVGPNAVYFLGRDGIYATDCQPGKPIPLTETTLKPIFQGRTYNDLEAIDWTRANEFRMTVTPKELHFGYVGVNAHYIHLVFDLERSAWSQWTTDGYYNFYHDEGYAANRLLMGKTTSRHTYAIDDTRPDNGTETFSVVARTGSLDNDIPLTYKEYGNIQIDADLDGVATTFTPYYNSEVTAGTAFSVTPDAGDGRRDYPFTLSDYYARSMAFQFAWTESPGNHPIFYQGNLLFRDEEERLTHWEQPPSALGNGGWFHIKDGYICIRSNSTVYLTVVIDSTITDVYTIASTGGEKLKKYIEFKPRKGKVYQFKLDSSATIDGSNKIPFRFYGEESLINGKPWITGSTYQPLTPFGPVGYAQYRRTEGGT